MAIIVTINQKGIRLESIKVLLESCVKGKYPEAKISVERKDPAESRADRFTEAQSLISDAKCEMEILRDELQEWHDNLPENLQQGSKADEIQEAIDGLETCVSGLDEAESTEVNFPGMY